MTEENVGTEEVKAELVRAVPATQAVSLIEMSADEFARMKGIATALAQASVFKDLKDAGGPPAAVAFAKMVVGRELGLGIAQSLQGLHLVEGQVTMHYSTMLSAVRSRGWRYRIVEQTAERCEIHWYEPGTDPKTEEPTAKTEYTMEDAITAGIVKRQSDGTIVTPRGRDSNYNKIPKTMLLARCVSTGVRAEVPEALGGMPVYVTGEIESSEVVDGMPGGGADSAGADVDIEAVLELVTDEGVQHRIRQAYHRAREVRPGQLSAAVIQMSVAGQRPEAVLAYAERLEAENAKAEAGATAEAPSEIQDAEVVEEPSAEEAAATESVTVTESVDVEALRQKLSDAMDRRTEIEENPSDEAETEKALADVEDEIREYEDLLREAGASVPGQESLL